MRDSLHASRATLYDPFPSAFNAGKAAILCRAGPFTFRTLICCAFFNRNHTFAITNRAGNPGIARIDAGAFTKDTFNCRFFNLNLALASTDLTGGKIRQQIKGVFARALAKRAFYIHLSFLLSRCNGSRMNQTFGSFFPGRAACPPYGGNPRYSAKFRL